MKKWDYVREELIGLTIRGAFQRAKVYANPQDTENPRRKDLQARLASLLRDLGTRYVDPVSNREHNANVMRIADDLTMEFGNRDFLRENRFRIGVAQKALNLYLKYLWCLEKVATPPHCPFDFGIIAKLPLSEQERTDLQWTTLDSLEGYQRLVDAGLVEIERTKHSSLSEWELEVWR